MIRHTATPSRRARRALLIVVLAAGTTAAAASPAAAAIGDCKPPPPFTTPADGPPAFIDSGPTLTPPSADPFAGEPKAGQMGPFAPPVTSIYEQFGYGGLQWIDYDPGCGDALVPGDSSTGTIANLFLGATTLFVAATVAFTRIAFTPASFALLDPIAAAASSAFGKGVFLPLIGVTLVALAIYMLVAFASKGRVAASANTFVWTLALVAAALATIVYPTVIAPKVDKAATTAVATAFNTIAGAQYGEATSVGDAVGASLTRSVLYETWCSGMVGRSSSDTARTFCPQLLAASTISRADLAAAQDDPKALAGLKAGQATKFQETADKLKEQDPGAYSYLAGHHNVDRIGYAVLGFLAWVASGGYVWIANLFLAYALIVVRGAIAVWPLVALIAIFPPLRKLAVRLISYAAGALASAVMLGFAAAIIVRATGVFISPTSSIPWPLAIVLLFLMSVAAWLATKPLRHVRHLARTLKNRAERLGSGEKGQDSALSVASPTEALDNSAGFYRGGPGATESFGKTLLRTAATGVVQGAALAAVTSGASVPATAAKTAATTTAATVATTTTAPAIGPAPAPVPALPVAPTPYVSPPPGAAPPVSPTGGNPPLRTTGPAGAPVLLTPGADGVYSAFAGDPSGRYVSPSRTTTTAGDPR